MEFKRKVRASTSTLVWVSASVGRCAAAGNWGSVDVTWASDVDSTGCSVWGVSGVVTIGEVSLGVSRSGLEPDEAA
jgi:hypothetical protein